MFSLFVFSNRFLVHGQIFLWFFEQGLQLLEILNFCFVFGCPATPRDVCAMSPR